MRAHGPGAQHALPDRLPGAVRTRASRLPYKDGRVGSEGHHGPWLRQSCQLFLAVGAGLCPPGGLQLLAVPQAFPRAWGVKLRPPAVVSIVFMGTPREVGDTVQPDQLSIND